MARRRSTDPQSAISLESLTSHPLSLRSTFFSHSDILSLSDARQFTPYPYHYAGSIADSARVLPRQTRGRSNYDLRGHMFSQPDLVSVCVRRQRRREVLHAFNRTGRGGARARRYRRNYYSDISCRR